VQKVDDSIYQLESPSQLGNQNSTPEYTLSIIEKTLSNATDFATVYNLYIEGQRGGEHVDVIKAANEFAQSLAETMGSAKGVSRLANDDDAADKLISVARSAGDVGLRFFESLQSFRIDTLPRASRTSVAVQQNSRSREALMKLSEAIDGLIPKGKSAIGKANGDIGDIVEQTMSSAALAIAKATQRLEELMNRPRDTSRFSAGELQVHDSILAAALAITSAIARLIRAATESQKEIVAQGKGANSSDQFYKRNSRWTEGLISAARSVAFATSTLIEAADGVLSGTHSLEQLIVASNEVAASTAQLVAASRVKANLMSKTQEQLELAAKAVTEAVKMLVKQVRAISARQVEEEDVDYRNMATLEFKKAEMEQQVDILRLEKELGAARHRLGAMRRAGYHVNDETA